MDKDQTQMMHLYLDNFRGFSDTFIPITNVNFLVGENSTGKTSVLGLLHLIASSKFWFTQNFNMEDVKFGHFHEIVSVHSDKRNYFRIGFVAESEKLGVQTPQGKQTTQYPIGFLATYKEHEGLPTISRYTFVEGNLQHTLKFTRTGVFYKSETVAGDESADMIRIKMSDVWVKEHRSGKSGYQKLPTPENFPKDANVDLSLARFILASLSTDSESKSNRRRLTFSFSDTTPLNPVVWMAPIRTQSQRSYDEVKLDYSSEGTHTPYVIRKILDSKKEATKFLSFMREVGKSSGLFESIGIKRHGKGTTAPFEVDIILDKKALNLWIVGYGVSQSLPVLVELFIRPEGTWFAIQQPEVHLHPRAQAALGDVFFDLAARERKCFLVETHSDFTIDRFRMNFRRSQRKVPHAQILFFERKFGRNFVCSIPIGKDGQLPRKQPASYRSFFMREELRSLGI